MDPNGVLPRPPGAFSHAPRPSKLLEEEKKPCQISEPASAPSVLQGNGCHLVSTPLIGRESGVLRSSVVSLA